MGVSQPFLYEAERSPRNSFPEKPFDPKAVTRASWSPKPVKKVPKGPLLGIHPDAHEVIGGRTSRAPVKMLTSRGKAWIKAMRVVQLLLRVLQLIAGAGILVLTILLTKMPSLTSWVLRITTGFVIVHSCYAVYHLIRPAGYRTPSSSSAYQVFAAFTDFCILPLYAYGAVNTRRNSSTWTTRLSDTEVLPYLTSSFYYTLIGATGVHLLTLSIAFWLAIRFRDIASMPPDMNPLGDRYTNRTKKQRKNDLKQQHLRNKSSVTTASTLVDSTTSLDKTKDADSRPPSVPFMHTRQNSEATVTPADPRVSLPSQSSPASAHKTPMTHLKRASLAGSPTHGRGSPTNGRGDYEELPLNDGGYANAPASRHSYHSSHPSNHSNSRPASRPGSRPDNRPDSRPSSRPDSRPGSLPGNRPPSTPIHGYPTTTVPAGTAGRQTRFTETWTASDSLAHRTQQRNQAINTLVMGAAGKRRNYAAVSQAFDFHDSDEEISDADTLRQGRAGHGVTDENARYDSYNYAEENRQPNAYANSLPKPNQYQNQNQYQSQNQNQSPVHSSAAADNIHRQPSDAPSMTSSVHTSTTVLSEVPVNDRRVSGGFSADIADGDCSVPALRLSNRSSHKPEQPQASNAHQGPNSRWTWAPRNRDSSIQPDEGFASKRYGDLRSRTPPVMVGEDVSRVGGSGRQVSSGNDYDLGSDRYLMYGALGGVSNTFSRRNVSGKIAEEGRAYSRYTMNN